MPRLSRWWLPTLLWMLLLTAAPAQTASQSLDTLPVSSLRIGMTGVGKTVIVGTEVQDFNVEIIGILERGGFNGGPMILVRGSGPVLDATGGFAGGYSGSPVYIDSKMIGAISAAWYFADGSIAGVTPIEEMLKNFAYPATNEGIVTGQPIPLAQAMELEGASLDASRIVWGPTPTAEQVAREAEAGVLALAPCKTPLFINGLNPELVERVKTELGPHYPWLEILPGPGPGMASAAAGNGQLDLFPGLVPGAAVGAQLVAGDIDFTAIGTLTTIDQGRVLAFGHPFLQAGAVELPLTKARIIHTMKSIQRSFKMGEATGMVGTINQDRAAAISGVLGQAPRMIPFQLTVKDTDLGRTRRYNYSVVDYEAILPFLGLLPPLQGLSEVMDRTGPATIRSHFRILTEELEPIERTNLFYDQFSGVGFLELVQGLFILTTQNIFEDVTVREVQIDVEVTQNRQTSDIIKAEIAGSAEHTPADTSTPVATEPGDAPTPHDGTRNPAPLQEQEALVEYYEMPGGVPAVAEGEPKRFKPGDSITVEVHLKPYRQPERRERLTVTIPADMPTGQTTLEIRGGGRLPSIFQLSAEAQGLPPGFMPQRAGPVTRRPPETLQDLIDVFLRSEKMNDLVVELYRPNNGSNASGTGNRNSSRSGRSGGNAADSGDGSSGISNSEPDAADAAQPEPIKTTLQTDRVIFGSVSLPVEIYIEEPPRRERRPRTEEPAPEAAPEADAPAERPARTPRRRPGQRF